MIWRDIWRYQPGPYFCIALKAENVWRNVFFTRDRFGDIEALIHRNYRTHDVYFSPNAYTRSRKTGDCAVRGHWLYADLDEVRPAGLELLPTIAVRTSRGRYHAYWKCDDNVDDDLAKRLVYYVGADRDSWSANKVLRVPGTLNHKRVRPEPVKLLWDDGPSYRVSELQRALPRLRTMTQMAVKSRQTSVSVDRLIERYAHVRVAGVSLRRCLGVCGPHKRSSIIFGLMAELLKAGASPDGAAAIVRASWSYRSRLEEKGEAAVERDLSNIVEKLL